MNVDIDNFHEIRERIREEELIEKSEFISFDLEFTGVKFENNERERWDMFLSEKYAKMSLVATKFNIIQFGVTFLIPTPEKKYKAYPFNFYVFPRQNVLCDPVISLQSGCVDFNTKQGMDWNRWIRKGINFIRISDYNKYLSPQKNRTYNQMYESMSPENKDYMTEILASLQDKQKNFQCKFEVPKYNSFLLKKMIEKYSQERKLNYEVALIHDQSDDDKMSFLIVRIISEGQQQKNETKRLESLIGFTLLFEKIWNSKKSFIGHNCLYDLLFIYSSFVDNLPTEYQNFKHIVSENRKFYDTKYITNQLEERDKMFGRGTSLEQIYKYYSQNEAVDNIELAPGFQKYDLKNPALHEAGFDSYLTAWVFLQLPRLQDCEGKLNIFKSFYTLNLKTISDDIRNDIVVFVVPVASYNAFIALDELRNMKIQHSKHIRECLQKNDVINLVMLSEGLKQIFIATKQQSFNRMVIKVLNKLKKEKVIMNVISLEKWVYGRYEASLVNKKKE